MLILYVCDDGLLMHFLLRLTVIVEEAEQILPYTFTGELQKYSLASDSEIVLDKLDWFFRISGVQKIELNWIWRKFGLL